MHCLITGVTGYIGSHLAYRLIQNGHQVTGLVHKTKPTLHDGRISYISGDITNWREVKDCAKGKDIVFHCAGLVNDYATTTQLFDVHVNGTKHLVQSCKNHHCARLIFLSHIPYESTKKTYPYPKSKALAESYLIDEFQKNGLPVVIIRPGNVYGPMAPTWVVRPMQAIKLKKIALIDGGCGIFHHTYIDNLVDVLVQTMDTRDIDGEIFNITDGDNSVTWKRYFDDLCLILGLQSIDKDFSSSFAKLLGHIMLFRERFFGISPLITPYAVEIFANTTKVFIEKAQQQLDYTPRIEYEEGISRIEQWINEQGIDSII